MSKLDNVNKYGITEIIVSFLMVFFGTSYTIASKVMMSTTCTEEEDGSPQIESFHKPLFQTFGMFFAMMLVLPMHWATMIFKLDFPGYEFGDKKDVYVAEKRGFEHAEEALTPKSSDLVSAQTTYMRRYAILAIPATLDLVCVTLLMIGMRYLDASIHSTLKSSVIIFVALLKHCALKQHLLKFHWVGVFWNLVSVVIIGMAAALASYGGEEGRNDKSTSETFLGVCLTISGAITQALKVVTEEQVMRMDNPAPPLLLIGMKGTLNTFGF